jgi:hypothetical protein
VVDERHLHAVLAEFCQLQPRPAPGLCAWRCRSRGLRRLHERWYLVFFWAGYTILLCAGRLNSDGILQPTPA